MRLGIATKVFIAFAAITLVFSLVLMFGVHRTQLLHGQIRALNHQIVPLSLHLNDIESDLNNFHLVLNEGDPAVLRRTLQLTRLLNTLPDDLGTRLQEAADMAYLSNQDDLPDSEVEAFSDVHHQLLDLSEKGHRFSDDVTAFSDLALDEDTSADTLSPQLDDKRESLRDTSRQIDESLRHIRDDLENATHEALLRADETERTSVYGLVVLSIVALITALILMYIVLATLRPLTDLTHAAKRIGDGDYRPVDLADKRLQRGDEISLLAREFNAMAQRLRRRDERLHHQHEALLRSERLATIGRMTSLITHELRNPLSSINLNAEMLKDTLHQRGIDDEDIMPLLDTVIDEVDHLSDITEEYLVYARLPSPDLETQPLKTILEALIDFHHWQWEQQEIHVQLHLPKDPIFVLADAQQLRQALLNIVQNAVDVSDPGQTIDISVSTSDAMALIDICDQGPGMDPDVQQRLFEPFYTTKTSGTGLGLPMTQEIIEQHDGHLRVQSTPGQGSTFTIELPLDTASRGGRA